MGHRLSLAYVLTAAVLAACSTNSAAPEVSAVNDTDFRIAGGNTGECAVEREQPKGKLTFVSEDPTSMDEYIVLMRDDVSFETYPLPANRDGSNDDAWSARAEAVARTQECAVAEVEALGGTYVSSFILINAFVARLTPRQATDLAGRSDIRSIEGNEGAAPPAGM